MRELAPGLWHWQATHPGWEESEPWGPEVSSYALDDGERLLLFDPLAVPGELEDAHPRARDGDRPHRALARARLAEPLRTPRSTGVHAASGHRGGAHGAVRNHRGAGRRGKPGRSLAPEGRGRRSAPLPRRRSAAVRPRGVPGHKPNDVALWMPDRGAVIVGDTLMDFGTGLHINERWLRFRPGLTRRARRRRPAAAARAPRRARAPGSRRSDRPRRPRASPRREMISSLWPGLTVT